MSIRKIQINITKFYLLSWLFGLIAVINCYYRNYIITTIFLLIFYSYSIADYRNPPLQIKPDDIDIDPPDDTIKPA